MLLNYFNKINLSKGDIVKSTSIFLCLFLCISSLQSNGAESTINISHAWVQEAPPNADVLAGYMELQNQSSQTLILVGARSDNFKSIMLHQTIHKAGMTHMNHNARIEISAGSTLQFLPGGYHLMLMNPVKPIRQGDQVQITLEFQSGVVLPIKFKVSKERPK